MVAHDSPRSAFELGEVWGLAKAGFMNYLLAYGIWYGISMIWSGVLYVAFMLGAVLGLLMRSFLVTWVPPLLLMGFVIVYNPLWRGALFGMAYHETQARLAADQA
jgi:hypothetical protein